MIESERQIYIRANQLRRELHELSRAFSSLSLEARTSFPDDPERSSRVYNDLMAVGIRLSAIHSDLAATETIKTPIQEGPDRLLSHEGFQALSPTDPTTRFEGDASQVECR